MMPSTYPYQQVVLRAGEIAEAIAQFRGVAWSQPTMSHSALNRPPFQMLGNIIS